MSLVLDVDKESFLGTLKFKGKEYQMSFPTYKQIKDFQEDSSSDENATEAYINLLVKMGIPKDVCENLPFNVMKAITKEITKEAEEKK